MFEKAKHLHNEIILIVSGHKSNHLKNKELAIRHINAAENEFNKAESELNHLRAEVERLTEDNKQLRECIYRAQEQGGEFNE